MILDDLLTDHKAQLGKVAARFTADDDADFIRHLHNAATRLSTKRLRWIATTLTLSSGVADYPAPADLLGAPATDWGTHPSRQPWDGDFVGYAPRLLEVDVGGTAMIRVVPTPTASQIAVWGATARVHYLARHRIDDAGVTFAEGDRPLVLLAALVEAMRELAADTTVVQLQKGLSGLPTAGTPAYLYEKLRDELERA